MPRYMGPFTVIQKINPVAYRVALPAHMKIHDVFNVSLLREYQPSGRTQPPPPPLEIEGEWEFEVETVLNERTVRRSRRATQEYHAKWKGYDAENNTWELEANLVNARDAFTHYRARRNTVS